MKVPNSENAIVDIRKLTDYCLNYEHPRGKHKARVFQSALGLTFIHAGQIRDVLLQKVKTIDCDEGVIDKYGSRYVVDFDYINGGKNATLRSTWIIKAGDGKPRLTSCFVL